MRIKTLTTTIASLFLTPEEIAKDYELGTLEDGVYDVTDIPRIMIEKPVDMDLSAEEVNAVQAFINTHGLDNIAIGAAYGTDSTILLAKEPLEIKTWEGGFNYGTSAIVTNCPREILILAEND